MGTLLLAGGNRHHDGAAVSAFQNWKHGCGGCKAVWCDGRVSAIQKSSVFLVFFFAGCGNDFSDENVERKKFQSAYAVPVGLFCDGVSKWAMADVSE